MLAAKRSSCEWRWQQQQIPRLSAPAYQPSPVSGVESNTKSDLIMSSRLKKSRRMSTDHASEPLPSINFPFPTYIVFEIPEFPSKHNLQSKIGDGMINQGLDPAPMMRTSTQSNTESLWYLVPTTKTKTNNTRCLWGPNRRTLHLVITPCFERIHVNASA